MNLLTLLLGASLASAHAIPQFGPHPQVHNVGNTEVDFSNDHPGTSSGNGINNLGNTDIAGSFFRRDQPSAPSTLLARPSQDSNDRSNINSRDFMPSEDSGGIAPVDLLQPGDNIAPAIANDQQHGNDEGNSFCFGGCYANPHAAKCSGPGVSCNIDNCIHSYVLIKS